MSRWVDNLLYKIRKGVENDTNADIYTKRFIE